MIVNHKAHNLHQQLIRSEIVQPDPDENVTQILAKLCSGDQDAAEQLLPIVYEELRIIAGRIFQSRNVGENTIQPTILVHDVFMKLVQKTDTEWKSRVHFFAVAAKAIRDLTVDHARRRNAAKRGGGWNRVTLSGVGEQEPAYQAVDVLGLEDALVQLREIAPRQEKIVELRFYAGLTVEEVASVLGISTRTVMYDWRMARAWLRKHLENEQE